MPISVLFSTDSGAMLGSIMLALCAYPLCLEALRTKNMAHVNAGFLALWFGGELLLFQYAVHLWAPPLLLNYGSNIALLLPVVIYKIWPKSK